VSGARGGISGRTNEKEKGERRSKGERCAWEILNGEIKKKESKSNFAKQSQVPSVGVGEKEKHVRSTTIVHREAGLAVEN